MALVAVPAVEATLSELVAVQRRVTVPEVPAVKVTLVPVEAEVIVPLVMLQAKVMSGWGEVSDAVFPVLAVLT